MFCGPEYSLFWYMFHGHLNRTCILLQLSECSVNASEILVVDGGGGVFFPVSLLIFCPVILSVVKRGVLRFTAIIVFLISALSAFVSCILQLCCLVHTHLGLLCLPGGLIHLLLCNILLCPWLFFFPRNIFIFT